MAVPTESTRRATLRNRILAIAALVLGAFLAGFIPQFRRAAHFQEELRQRDETINKMHGEANLQKARNSAGLLYLELTRKNYGIAQQHANALFNQIGGMTRNASPQLRPALEKILGSREMITSGIAKADPEVVNALPPLVDQVNQLPNP